MFKNISGQKYTVLAFADAGHATLDAGEIVTGDAANITMKIEQDDDGTRSASNDVNPTETEDGQYVFDLTQSESNGNKNTFYPQSSTAGVQVVGQPSNVIYTNPPNYPTLGIESDGDVTKVNLVAVNTDTAATLGTPADTDIATDLVNLSAQVSGIASSSGVGFPNEMTSDNTTRDTIDAAAAVDKGGGLVGIPATGHAYVAGQEVTITGTANYDASYDIVSQTTNEVVITASFVSETFSVSDTINASFKGVEFIGTQTTNTFAATEAADGTLHVLTHVGNTIDIVYKTNVTGSRIAVESEYEAFLNSNNDSITIQLYDFVGDVWDTVDVLAGQNGSLNVVDTFTALQKHTGTGDDLGDVLTRWVSTGGTSPVLSIDKLISMSSNLGQSIGYDNASTWINSASLNTGIVPFEDAVGDKPTSTLDLARTIADSVGLVRFTFLPGSSTTLTQSFVSKELLGVRWTLAGGTGFDLTNSRITGASSVTGIFTGTGQFSFVECGIGNVTMHPSNGLACGFSGVFTMGAAGSYTYGESAGFNITVDPEFDFAGFGASTLSLHGWSDGVQISNMAAGDKLVITGEGQLTINASCADATLVIAGNFSLDNQGTNMTIDQVARVDRPAINAECDTALSDIHLDHLMAVAAADVVVDGSVISHMVSATEDWSTFAPSTDSLEAVRDRGDTSWLTATGFSTLVATDILSDGNALNTASGVLDVVNLTNTVTTYTGNTKQTGDTFALANGASGFVATNTVVDSILVDTGSSGVIIAAAQGPVTFTGVTNEAGITLAGQGTGAGFKITGGATGHGILATGGATSGSGITANASAFGSGSGMTLVGTGANPGLSATGGATGGGILGTGGSTSGDGLELAANGSGVTNADLVAITALVVAVPTEVFTFDVDNVEATAGVDTLTKVVLMAGHSDTTTNTGKLTVFRTNGTTEFEQITIITSASAEHITSVK